MDNFNFLLFTSNLRAKKRVEGSRQMSITPKNLGCFTVKTFKDGEIDLRDIVDLYDWAKDTLQRTAGILNYIADYHPKSPTSWMKNLSTQEVTDYGFYSVGIDLEQFIPSKAQEEQKNEGLDSFIPNNYELAKKVLKEFKKAHKGHKLVDNSFRDLANWESKSLESVVALAEFIQEKYIGPKTEALLKEYNIKDCVFGEEDGRKNVDFIYND